MSQPKNEQGFTRLEGRIVALLYDPLTDAEIEARCRMPRTNKEVAAALGISVRTVDKYLYEMKAKFDVSSRAELYTKWLGLERGNA